jgi:O-antigen ligase
MISKTFKKEIAIWSLILFFLTQATKIFSFWKETTSAFDVDVGGTGNTIIGLIGLISLFFNLLLIKDNFTQFIYVSKKIKMFYILFGFFCISFLWSEVPFITIKRTFKFFILLVGILSVSLEKELYLTFFKRLIIIVIVSSFILVFTPFGWMTIGEKTIACGIMTHKSNIAGFCAISILFSFFYKNTKSFLLIIILSTLILLLTQGKNPLLNLILAISYTYFMRVIKNKIFAFTFILCNILLFLIIYHCYHYDISIEYLLSLIGKEPTLTGRTSIWLALINIGARMHPFLGFGFDSFFIGEKSAWILKFLEWDAPEAHSGYLKIFLEGGIIGLLLWTLYIISLLHSILSLKNYKNKYYLSAFVLYSTFYNIVSNSFFTFRLDFMILISITCFHPLLDQHKEEHVF